MAPSLPLLMLAGLLLAVILVTMAHFRPLSHSEVVQLAQIRRGRRLRAHYSFDRHQHAVDPDLKRRMKPEGAFSRARWTLSEFPAFAAGLLKHKKHEWILFAFEVNGEVALYWENKGPDGSRVGPKVPLHDLVETATRLGATSIMMFHNHPNPNPGRFSCSGPSPRDVAFAEKLSRLLCPRGVNHISFVCERGSFHEFHCSLAPSFIPIGEVEHEIRCVNAKSPFRNLALHLERIFGPRRRSTPVRMPELAEPKLREPRRAAAREKHNPETVTTGISRVPVLSSAFKSIGYDPLTSTLEVEFVSGGVYRYLGVPAEVFSAFLTAESHGGFYHQRIAGRYRETSASDRA